MSKATNVPPVLFLDIETAARWPSYDQMSEREQRLWDAKAVYLKDFPDSRAAFCRAGIYAEFGRVVCISTGMFRDGPDGLRFQVRSFDNTDEAQLLQGFKRFLEKAPLPGMHLCAHNGKEFDFPFLCRRFLAQGIELPPPLQLMGKKPWEQKHFDTLEMWKFGDYKHYVSLELLCMQFGIESPKGDFDGSMVHRAWWEGADRKRIRHYCEKDLLALASVFLCLHGKKPLENELVEVLR